MPWLRGMFDLRRGLPVTDDWPDELDDRNSLDEGELDLLPAKI